jgi:cold shock CspA family protein
MAWLYAEQLSLNRKWVESERVMKPFDHCWALILRCGCAYAQGRNDETAQLAREVLKRAHAPLPDVMELRRSASMWLERTAGKRRIFNRDMNMDIWRFGWIDGLQRPLEWRSRPPLQRQRTTTLKSLISQLLTVTNTGLPPCEPKALRHPATWRRPQPCTRGTVHWYSPQKRFGFIRPARGDRWLMFDSSQLQHLEAKNIRPGLAVAYTPVDTQLGLEAHDLHVP